MSSRTGYNNATANPSSGYSGIQEHSGMLHSFLEHATVLVFPLVFGLNLHWASSRLYELELLWLMALAIPLGVVGGDLVSNRSLGGGHLRF